MRQTERPTMRKFEENFISFPAFYSIEINAQVLTFILLLVLNKTLPTESLNICLFSSQPCGNMFHCARAVTGPFTTMTNFTVQELLSKARKISILNEIKTLEGSNTDSNAIKFPVHHKQHQNNLSSSMLTNLDGITIEKIEENINEASEYAKSFMEKLEMSSLMKKNNVFELNDLCLRMHSDDNSNESINHLDEQTINSYLSSSDSNDEIDQEHDSEDGCAPSTKDGFNGMRIYSSITDKDKEKFF
ncbi:unnamed protein product [Rotaria magnacalcarata]|uniref:Uncharacterized protein n=1 Tax=Rotaria magnacalcarata TaxID=392030 RepID=A0A816MZ06_9BILA|nr:unnamed protein product [Rotaria magnacalcarata]